MKRLVAATGAAFCALVALLGLYELRMDYRKRNAYKATSCTVVSRAVVEEPTSTSTSGLGADVEHHPVRVAVRFAYRVDGRDYVGEDARFFEKGESAIAAHYGAHAPASTHACWYDPDRPGARAVLAQDVSYSGSLMMLGVGVAGTIGFGLIFRMLGAVRRE